MSARESREGALGALYDRAPRAEEVIWQLRGLCTQYDPDIFQDEHPVMERAAKAVCHQCPVIEQCRIWALDKHEGAGVWGGLSIRDREYIWTGRRRNRSYRDRAAKKVLAGRAL